VLGDDVYAIADLDLQGVGNALPQTRLSMIDVFEVWGEILPVLRRAAERLVIERSSAAMSLVTLKTLAPCIPRQIICAGANYRKHVIEILMNRPGATADPTWSLEERRSRAEAIMDHRAAAGQPFAFIKAASSVLDPFADLPIPADSSETDWELELGVVIGRKAWRVGREKALAYVLGYVICNDITARDRINRPDFPTLGLDFIAGKSAPGFLPFGPVIVPAEFIPDPQNLMLTLSLNGNVMQHDSTADMIFTVAQLIEFVSTHMQLWPGDVICTGSPSGNGIQHKRFLSPGDLMEGSIDKLGRQINRCAAEAVDGDAVLHRAFVPLDKRSP